MGKENSENPTLKTDISIYEAFFNAQSEFGIVPATAANSYYKKADGKASAYSSLADIERTIRPALVKNGLFYIQRPEMLEGHSGVKMTTDIMNLNGEKIEWFPIEIPTAKKDSQGVGSAITYARRYSLLVTLGLSTDEIEDNGNHSSDLSRSGRENVASTAPVVWRQAPATPTPTAPAKPTFTPYGDDNAFNLFTLVDSLRGNATDDQLKAKFIATLKLFGYIPTPDIQAKKLYDIMSSIPVDIGEKTKAYFAKKVAEAETGKTTTEPTPPADEARASLTPTAE